MAGKALEEVRISGEPGGLLRDDHHVDAGQGRRERPKAFADNPAEEVAPNGLGNLVPRDCKAKSGPAMGIGGVDDGEQAIAGSSALPEQPVKIRGGF